MKTKPLQINQLIQNTKTRLIISLAPTLIILTVSWQIGWNIYTTYQLWETYLNTDYALILAGVAAIPTILTMLTSMLLLKKQADKKPIKPDENKNTIRNLENQLGNKKSLRNPDTIKKINETIQSFYDQKFDEQYLKNEKTITDFEKENQPQEPQKTNPETTENTNDKKPNNEPALDIKYFEICQPDTLGAIKIENLNLGISYNSTIIGKVAKDQTLYIKFKGSKKDPLPKQDKFQEIPLPSNEELLLDAEPV